MATVKSRARDWETIPTKMTPAQRERAKARAQVLLEEMPLHELRRARALTQETLAAVMGEQQSAISRIERQTDMYLSTLRRYVEAMGGQLEMTARFPDGNVRIVTIEAA